MAIATSVNAIYDMKHGDQIVVRNETFTLEVAASGGVSLDLTRAPNLCSIRCAASKGSIFSRHDLVTLLLSGGYFFG